ncbi:hypothetical protein CV093_05260 [Oceanobacillus sp. 143]|uniref:Lipoprotein n=1 Tax=Oceanobacillus zhaokaii TaxID=2052660 RepID=A0A345PE99_9BACI|nr:hypothetical protein [Oceanobacillus zhaokaii]AXI08329.1 hypothetical protein CUC15_05005 [Oceanobacillus zhaokaii]QGS68238.1 hypothetical protein CV093_05260 [Oceanobacillus sp. 143]
MKGLTKTFYFIIVLFMLAGCGGNTNEESATDSLEKNAAVETAEGDAIETEESTLTSELEESDIDDANHITSEESVSIESDSIMQENSETNEVDKEDDETLSQYSSEQIEFARVWRQLGPNQEIDVLDVQHIPAGTLLNPDDGTDVGYPEDVIQLRGSRLVDGIVTYSGNGDGTINVYNVPSRWYGGFPPPDDIDKEKVREDMEDIINNTKLVYVDPGDDKEIIELIELLNVHY